MSPFYIIIGVTHSKTLNVLVPRLRDVYTLLARKIFKPFSDIEKVR